MEYSLKELALIKHYFPERVDYFATSQNLTAYPLYRMMTEQAFIQNQDDIFSQSLRRCMYALVNCKVYRLTPEWDALIDDGVLK